MLRPDPFVMEAPLVIHGETKLEDLRMAWRDACADVRLAYLDWREAGPEDTADAFASYVAAAEREAAAADTLCLAATVTPAPQPAASRTCESSRPS
jgi:hypothetical protein